MPQFLDNETQAIEKGTLVFHSCHNAIPPDTIKCPFCHRFHRDPNKELFDAQAQEIAELKAKLAAKK